MPALATITLNDYGANAKNFSIESSGTNNNGVFAWKQRGSAVPVRYEQLFYSNKRGRGSNLLVHHYKLIVPITDTPSGGLERQVAQCMFDGRFYVPDNAPVAKRQDFATFVKNLCAHTSFLPVIADGESYY